MITHCSAFNSHTRYWTKCETDTLVTLNIHSFEMCCQLITTKAMCFRIFYSPLFWSSYYDAKTRTLKWYKTVKRREAFKNLMQRGRGGRNWIKISCILIAKLGTLTEMKLIPDSTMRFRISVQNCIVSSMTGSKPWA